MYVDDDNDRERRIEKKTEKENKLPFVKTLKLKVKRNKWWK